LNSFSLGPDSNDFNFVSLFQCNKFQPSTHYFRQPQKWGAAPRFRKGLRIRKNPNNPSPLTKFPSRSLPPIEPSRFLPCTHRLDSATPDLCASKFENPLRKRERKRPRRAPQDPSRCPDSQSTRPRSERACQAERARERAGSRGDELRTRSQTPARPVLVGIPSSAQTPSVSFSEDPENETLPQRELRRAPSQVKPRC
jgi:hypothetical protein